VSSGTLNLAQPNLSVSAHRKDVGAVLAYYAVIHLA